MEREHRDLAALIERAAGVCRHSVDPAVACSGCGEAVLTQCRGLLDAFAADVCAQLIEHIHREDAVIDSLQQEAAHLSSCQRHRNEHSRFVAAFNRLAVEVRFADVRYESHLFEQFLLEWVRDHVMVFGLESGWPRQGGS